MYSLLALIAFGIGCALVGAVAITAAWISLLIMWFGNAFDDT